MRGSWALAAGARITPADTATVAAKAAAAAFPRTAACAPEARSRGLTRARGSRATAGRAFAADCNFAMFDEICIVLGYWFCEWFCAYPPKSAFWYQITSDTMTGIKMSAGLKFRALAGPRVSFCTMAA